MSIKSSAEAARAAEVISFKSPGRDVMRCKLVLHAKGPAYGHSDTNSRIAVRFGGVWEGSIEKQKQSENAVFGEQTPHAEFVATISNASVTDKLVEGRKYIVTFTEVE